MLIKIQEHPDLGAWCSKDSEIEFYDLGRYAKALTDDHQKERTDRMSRRVTRSGGRKKKKDSENKLLVVYPFGVDETILSEASSGLKELGGDSLGIENVSAVDNTSQPDDVQMQDSSDAEDAKGKSSRMHYVTIRDEDIERLCPGQFLNDTLVDFFMRW
jgi:Ulp1 family protease